MSQNYFQDELRYLRDVGPEFARMNPEIARLLGDRGTDPDVERLLEGFAFLSGRIRQKLDDDLPEITASLMSLLWPHYLRPVPSMTILELLPDLNAMQAPLSVPAGAGFSSLPVDGTSCRYRSAWPVSLRPWAIEDVRLETMAASPFRLVMRFRCSPKSTLENLELDHVMLHLAGDPAASFFLYLLMAAHVEAVTISNGSDNHNRPELAVDPRCVQAAGLSREEGVLPYPKQSFPGYRLLQEYLAFKERFLFVSVSGLDKAVQALELESTLEIAITFNRLFEDYPVVTRDNVRLHCVPIINLFAQPADPIRSKHDRTEHLLLPSKAGAADRRHLEVFSVDQVAGLSLADSPESRTYEPFYSFRHHGFGAGGAPAYYQTHVRPNVATNDPRDGTDTYVSFVPAAGATEIFAEETLSMELTCTNRDLPAALRAGDITQPTDSSPPGVRFRNLLKPTQTIPPPLGRALHWRLVSHMALNYISITDADRLREVLRVYDFLSAYDAQQAKANERMREGILEVKPVYCERLLRGCAVKGTRLEIVLHEDHFAGEGDAYLFGVVIERFLALYATINGFTQLSLRMSRSGHLYDFPPRWGEQLSPAGARGVMA